MDKIDFDPIRDEKKQYTMEQFLQIMKELTKDLGGDPADHNDWQKQPHTFDEWFGSFVRWKSW